MKVLSVNFVPIASKCPIGYMSEHLFNDPDKFQVMELYCRDDDIYKDITYRRYKIDYNSLKIKDISSVQSQNDSKRTLSKLIKNIIKILVPVSFDSALLEKIKTFSPDVIYTQGYNYQLLKAVNKLSDILKRPVITHTLDNWFSDNLFRRFLETRSLKAAFKKSNMHLAASPLMVRFLREKFHVNSTFISNCIPYTNNHPVSISGNNEKLMIYTGNLTPDRYTSLNDVVSTLHKLSSKITLHVYAPIDQINEFKGRIDSSIVLHNSVAQKQVKAIISEADFLLHVETFEKEHQNFIHYSLSTKIAEYLATKKPLIYYGPLNVGVADFLLENKIGFVTDSCEDLLKILKFLISSPEIYQTVSEDGFQKGYGYFDSFVVRLKFFNIIKSVSSNYKKER